MQEEDNLGKVFGPLHHVYTANLLQGLDVLTILALQRTGVRDHEQIDRAVRVAQAFGRRVAEDAMRHHGPEELGTVGLLEDARHVLVGSCCCNLVIDADDERIAQCSTSFVVTRDDVRGFLLVAVGTALVANERVEGDAIFGKLPEHFIDLLLVSLAGAIVCECEADTCDPSALRLLHRTANEATDHRDADDRALWTDHRDLLTVRVRHNESVDGALGPHAIIEELVGEPCPGQATGSLVLVRTR